MVAAGVVAALGSFIAVLSPRSADSRTGDGRLLDLPK